MAENNVNRTTVTQLTSGVPLFQFNQQQPQSTQNQDETYYYNTNFAESFTYYKQEGQLKKAIDALATYTTGKGYTCDVRTKVILDYITGNGKETFNNIAWNAIVVKLINKGGSFTQVIRDGNVPTGLLLNLKPLNPLQVVIVFGRDGRIKHYLLEDPKADGGFLKLEKWEVFHLINDKVVNEMCGTSVIEACKWIIDARNEALNDWRRISHRSTIRILYIDVDNTTRMDQVRTQYKEAISKGEVLILPMKKGDAEFADLTLPPVEQFLAWIRYCDSLFWMQVGVPKVVLGGSEEFTEASSKTALLTFDQVWQKNQTDFELEFWNQIGLQIQFNEPMSLKNEVISDETKNTGQTGFQSSDAMMNSATAGGA